MFWIGIVNERNGEKDDKDFLWNMIFEWIWKWDMDWRMMNELFMWLMNLKYLRYEVPWIKCRGLPPRVPGWKLDTLLTLRRKCVTGHYMNSRECYPHWVLLIIWEKLCIDSWGCTSGDSLSTIQTCRVGWITDRWASSAIGQACIICILLELLVCALTGYA